MVRFRMATFHANTTAPRIILITGHAHRSACIIPSSSSCDATTSNHAPFEVRRQAPMENSQRTRSTTLQMLLHFSVLCLILMLLHPTYSWSPPVMSTTITPPVFGLGAIFLRPMGMKTTPSLGEGPVLLEATDFFVDAFWTSKCGGGAKVLSDAQRKSLSSNQLLEFRRRYGAKRNTAPEDRRAELLLCRNGRGDTMGCVGIEVDKIPEKRLSGPSKTRAPLMSNLAVGRKFRRRGIAEELVAAAENVATKQWGYDECYLYVEKRNTPAVKLYRKLGYRKVWEDDTARTLVPMDQGGVMNTDTTLVCMKKNLRGGVFGRLFSF